MPEGAKPIRTPVYPLHVSAGAVMFEEAGWEMPYSYGDVQAECAHVRQRAGVFDVSHLSRIRVRGDGAAGLLERLCTADVARQEDDTARYSLLLNDDGGILADALVVRLEKFWVLSTAPQCRAAVLERAKALAGDFGAAVDDQTPKTAMVAVAGPAAPAILDAVLPERASRMGRGSARSGSVLIAKYIAIRTGFMGQWCLEVMLPNMLASQGWRFITHKAGANCVPPAGLAARDLLRIEAGVPRFARELGPDVDCVCAGLMRAVDLGHDFIGRDAVRRLMDSPPARKLVGLAAEKGIAGDPPVPPRGTAVLDTDGTQVGAVTSIAHSDVLGRIIAMAYVASAAAHEGTELRLAAPEAPLPVRVTAMPFVGPGSVDV